MDGKTLRVWRIAAAAACLVALGDWPYAYYQLLRWLVAGVAGASAWAAFEQGRTSWAWTLVAVAVLFNPLVPVHFDRDAWRVLDPATAVLLITASLRHEVATSP